MEKRSPYQERFFELMAKDGADSSDVYRKALFCILAHEHIYPKVQNIYDFKDHSIIPEGLESTDFSGGLGAMVELAFNLYNGFDCQSPIDIFIRLDSNSFEICLMAIRIRFNQFPH